jgi:hypothetical protein
MTNEQRDFVASTFIAVYDALMRAAVPTYMVSLAKMPDLPRPSYLPAVPPQTPAQYTAALAKLGRLGIVKRAD